MHQSDREKKKKQTPKASQKKPKNGLMFILCLSIHPSVLMEVLYVLKAAAEPNACWRIRGIYDYFHLQQTFALGMAEG